jgi:hypothetical protein
MRLKFPLGVTGVFVCAAVFSAEPEARPKQDANGNSIRYAATGHASNYDEAKVGAYTLPDLLVLRSGERVREAAAWTQRRRPELIALYQSEIYGRVPATAPAVTWETVSTTPGEFNGLAVRKHLVGRFGPDANGPKVNVVLHVPAQAKGPVPLLVHLLFSQPPGLKPPAEAAPGKGGKAPAVRPLAEVGPIADMLARGYAYATFRYTEIEGDRADTNLGGVRGLALAKGQEKPAAGEWGTIGAWAWGTSRVLDQLVKDPALDAQRIGLIGHSRLGKTVLWAGACDERFGVIFSSCSGEMGAALARRDFGETVDDMAANFPWQFTGAFQKYAGHWNDLPVDAHTLIALAAPRAVFVTGGTKDLWADPKGEFLAQVAAGPVYRLLGRKDLGTTEGPPLDRPLTDGSLGFHYHTGGHTITPEDWTAFFDFAGKTLRPVRP